MAIAPDTSRIAERNDFARIGLPADLICLVIPHP